MDKEFPMIPATGRSSEEVIFADAVFGFWEDVQALPENSSNSGNRDDFSDHDEDETVQKDNNKAFWEEQDQLLQVQFQILGNIPHTLCLINTTFNFIMMEN